jgi:hypothetical protein
MDANFCFVESEMRIGLPGLPTTGFTWRQSVNTRTCFAFRVDLSQHVFVLEIISSDAHRISHAFQHAAIYGCFPADQATCGVGALSLQVDASLKVKLQ